MKTFKLQEHISLVHVLLFFHERATILSASCCWHLTHSFTLFLDLTDNPKTHHLAGTLPTSQPGHECTSLDADFCLFVCLSVWGGFASDPPLHLYLLPWQQSSRDTQLSSCPLPQSAWPTDCFRGASLSLWYAWAALTESSPWGLLWHHRLPGRQPGGGSALLSLASFPPTVRLKTKSF